MTNDELEAIRKRAEAAHPGPWTHGDPETWIWGPSEKGGITHVADIRGWGYLTGRGDGGLRLGEDEAFARQKATGAFIAHARTDVPALLDEVARLREQHEIVARIWKILGSPTYEELQGDTIYDVIEKRLARATRAEAHAERLDTLMRDLFDNEEVQVSLGGNPITLSRLDERIRQALHEGEG